jgi:hypothetical protein
VIEGKRPLIRSPIAVDFKYPSGIPGESWLLGVDWGGIDWANTPQGTAYGGMTAVVPAWKIVELLDQEAIVNARKKRDEELRREAEKPGTVKEHGTESYTEERFLADLVKATRPLPKGEKPDPT